MEKQEIIHTLQDLKKDSKRKFNQAIDLIIALKDLDLKKPEDQVEFFINLPYSIGQKRKICAFVGRELLEDAKKTCDLVIEEHDFDAYKDKKREAKKLGMSYDFFIAQANIMAKVAAAFGRALGTRGKMPNPKAGCVVPPNANLKPLIERLQNTIKVSAKKIPVVQVKIGTQSMPEEEVADNMLAVYKQLISHLPKEKHNVKNIYLKLTMSKPIKLH